MTDRMTLSPQDRSLWQDAKARWAVADDSARIDAGLLAEYLDGGLSEAEREEIEGLLAASPATLDLLLAARAGMAAETAVPKGVIDQAVALVEENRKKTTAGGRGFFTLPNLSWVAATLALVIAVSIAGFEVGRDGYARAETLLHDNVRVGVLGVSERDFAM